VLWPDEEMAFEVLLVDAVVCCFNFVARDYVPAGLIVLVVVLDSLRGIASSRVNEVSLAGARVPCLIVELSEMSISGLFC